MASDAIYPQYVSCGKPNCRCAKGDLHGPYYYHFSKRGGKLKKQYIRVADVKGTLAATARV